MTLANLAPIPELYVSAESAAKLKIEAGNLPSWDLTARQVCDLELLMNGGFNPLKGFLTEADYDGVVETMRIADGALWPMPDHARRVARNSPTSVEPGQDIALRDPEGVILAILSVTDKWTPNKAREADKVFGADDLAHPAVNYLHNIAGPVYLGGPITGIQQPVHYDFKARRDTPNELRAYFRKLGWRRVVAFQTRNPLHRAHQELTFRAAREAQANLLIHPVVGMTKPGDVDHFTRVRCYEAVLDQYPASTTHLSLLNLAMRMAGPREAVWHAIIRKNHGCTHFIVGPRPCRPGQEQPGQGFLRPLRRAGTVRRSTRRKSASRWSISSRWSMCRKRPSITRSTKCPKARPSSTSRAPNCAAACAKGWRSRTGSPSPQVVTELRRTSPAAVQAGLHGLLHRPVRVGQVDHRQRPDGQADGDGRPPGDAAGRRRGAQAPVLGTRVLQGTPRHQHQADRLRRLRDHQERRHRHLRARSRPTPPRAAPCAR